MAASKKDAIKKFNAFGHNFKNMTREEIERNTKKNGEKLLDLL